jgi:hypothetical protein
MNWAEVYHANCEACRLDFRSEVAVWLPVLRQLDGLCCECYHEFAQEVEVIANGLDPFEESPNSIERDAG